MPGGGGLVSAASVKPATASGHLTKPQEADLVACEARRRHRYHRMADQDVAHALEALALVAERSSTLHEAGCGLPAVVMVTWLVSLA